MESIINGSQYCIYCKELVENDDKIYHEACKKEMDDFNNNLASNFEGYKQMINILEDFIWLSEYCKHSYFWSPWGNAQQRRKAETRLSREEQTIKYKKDIYVFSATMSMSARNAYFSKYITKNGKQTNVRVLKTLLTKLKENGV